MSLERGKWFYTCMVAMIGEWNWSLLYILALLASWWYSWDGNNLLDSDKVFGEMVPYAPPDHRNL
jgi:hypothetical protein